MKNFQSFPFPDSVQKSLQKLGLQDATDVQSQAIPEILDGKDIIVSAPTGTGKTLAFILPIITKILSEKNYHAVVITPTRELAAQIHDIATSLLRYNYEIKSALLIGGVSIEKQLKSLKASPQIIIGTPGRINDHLERKSLRLNHVKMVVLDEMDRMLDMGFSVQIDKILKFVPETKQVAMLSATIPPAILKLCKKYLNEPAKVTIDAAEIVNTNIEQEFLETDKGQKYHDLLDQLHKREGAVIIFTKTRRNSEELARKLCKDSFKAKAIHGNLRQHQRDKIVRLFRQEEFRIVVATDVAARGLDVPHIKHVINYNLPTNPEDYVHRVGRTGRAGQTGSAISFITDNETKEWYALDHFLNPDKKRERPRNSVKKKRSNNSRKRGSSQDRGGRFDRPKRRDDRDDSGDDRPRRRDDREGGNDDRPQRRGGRDDRPQRRRARDDRSDNRSKRRGDRDDRRGDRDDRRGDREERRDDRDGRRGDRPKRRDDRPKRRDDRPKRRDDRDDRRDDRPKRRDGGSNKRFGKSNNNGENPPTSNRKRSFKKD